MSALRLLVADDHELVRRGIRALLSSQRGWKVVCEATNGREAVEKATKLKPDVAIVDISMPELDGLQATRQIRAVNSNTEVVVITMHESDRMVRRVLDAGARGYVLKSDLAPHLVMAVKQAASHKLFLSPSVSEIVLAGFLKPGNQAGTAKHSRAHPTPREIQIIQLLAAGNANKAIAADLGITVRTAETHRARIMLKLGLHSLTELIHYAIRQGIFTPPAALE
jgi:DNA-binding NarL/FixJ family response regulator